MELTPITRKEHFLAKAAGNQAAKDLDPITREEWFISQIRGGGGGGEVTPASVALAISQMSDAQAAQALADLGYAIDSVIDANSENPVTNHTLAMTFLAAQAALDSKADSPIVVEIDSSITTPTITPTDNHIYNCGELTSLTISSPPASGSYSIVFTSGATPTVTSFPATILGLEDFAAEADTIYEINVLDGRAVWKGWPLPASE